MDWESEYAGVIAGGVAAITVALRDSGGAAVQVYWRRGSEDAPGAICAGRGVQSADGWQALKLPLPGSCWRSWGSIPLSALYSVLWHGCKGLPLLSGPDDVAGTPATAPVPLRLRASL